MTPKEKAEELVDKMQLCYEGNIDYYTEKQCESITSEKCALIAIDEIINLDSGDTVDKYYWEQVKEEIKKL